MSIDYLKLTKSTMEWLPPTKQAEVYDFAAFLKSKTKNITSPKKSQKSILDLIGIGQSDVKDAALNHDNYLYD